MVAHRTPAPQAQGRLDAVTRRLQELYPRSNTGQSVRVVSLEERLVGDVRGSLLMLLGAVALVLAIAYNSLRFMI